MAYDLNIHKELKKMYKEIFRLNEFRFSENSMKLFKRISGRLSTNLPKVSDETLFAIDDILHRNDISHEDNIPAIDVTTEIPSEQLMKCAELHLVIYLKLLSHTLTPPSRILESTFLQVLQLTKVKQIKKHRDFLRGSIANLLAFGNTSRLCLCLKILKIVLANDRDFLLNEPNNKDDNGYYWMLKYLPNIPQGRNPEQKRITDWMIKEASFIIGTSQLDASIYRQVTQDCMKYCEIHQEHDTRFISHVRYDLEGSPYIQSDYLFSFFTSATNNDEKRKRLRDFLMARTEVQVAYWEEKFGKRIEKSSKEILEDLTSTLSSGVVQFFDLFRQLLEGIVYSDDELRKMEEKFGCNIKAYLEGDVDELDENSKSHLKPSSLTNSGDDDKDDHEFWLEKYFFYDGFVKNLNLLNIIYTAYVMCNELTEISGDITDYETLIFRKPHHPITIFIKEAILKPSKRGHIPWLIEIMIKKCPFMILPKRCEYMMGDLIKLLKGHQMDEVVEEKIFLAVNTKRW